MKFLDPWAIFQYIGGAFTIHCLMAIYCWRQVHWMNEFLDRYMEEPEACIESCFLFDPTDIMILCSAHIFGMVVTIQQQLFKSCFREYNFGFLNEFLKVVNILAYSLSILLCLVNHLSNLITDC